MAGRFNGNSEYKHELERVRDLYVDATKHKNNDINKPKYLLNKNKSEVILSETNKIANIQYIKNMDPIGRLNLSDYQNMKFSEIKNAVANFYKTQYGGKVINDVLGEVLLTKKGLSDSLAHNNYPNKIATFNLVPEAIINGKIINVENNWKGRNYDTATIAAKVLNENDDDLYLAVIVRQSQEERNNRYYLHEIYYATEEELKKEPIESSTYVNDLGRSISSSNENISHISDMSSDDKPQFSISTDTNDRALSEQQQEYFKNSKVVDKDGNLKVMYRGGNEDINVFDRKKSRTSNLYGRGFYFTDSEAHAKQYGEAREYYLNITNPLWNEKNITREQIVKLLQAIEDDGEDMDLSNYGYGAAVESIADSLMEKDDYGKLFDISTTAVGNLVKTTELFNELNGTTYDGFILPTETVVFNSNQIKNVDNVNPTENKDIHYSISSKYTNDVKDIMKKVWFITNA